MLVAPRNRSQRPHSAFTLIEVMVGVMLLAILLPSFYLGLSQGFSVVRVTRENLRANQILQEKMEIIRLYTFDEISSNGYVPATFTAYADPIQTNGSMVYSGQITITNTSMSESYASDHKSINVTLTWPSGNITRQREVSTTVSKYGLHNYYY